MQRLSLDYAAGAPAARRALAGVVGSGDLEVLLEPGTEGRSTVEINTSVDGVNDIWTAVVGRIFADATQPAVALEINDFGATPAVVRLRIAQAMESAAGRGEA
ncbi:malonate decarboxylase subunit delta [Endozoicomonas sp. G2_2]|uniref:malonate decarboxylase subunit delta n=1 Tax=Endozoicomonas sp. G2_2 TaxID=2821092 RepID=UPI001ADC4A3F|nr:malonate decarboxylase subunit delta [Endozoicomonas sp. G2_2]MBO9471003.1 malonate decarboxylase subunit delta [Endozoicomonas sp. G2_2]